MHQNHDEFIIAVIEQAFAMRKVDAFQRCNRQIDIWQRQKRSVSVSPDEREKIQSRVKHLRSVFIAHLNKYAPREDDGANPEGMVHRAYRGPDNVASLMDAGKLTTDHERAVREIQAVIEAVTAAQHARGPRFEKSGSYGNNDFMKNYIAHWWSWRYVPWSNAVMLKYEPHPVRMIRGFITDGLSLSSARVIGRMSYERALVVLVDVLDMYNKIKQQDEEYDPDKANQRLPASLEGPYQSYRSE